MDSITNWLYDTLKVDVDLDGKPPRDINRRISSHLHRVVGGSSISTFDFITGKIKLFPADLTTKMWHSGIKVMWFRLY